MKIEGHTIAADEAFAKYFGIEDQPGYLTPFTRRQWPLAKYMNGARVRKVWQDRTGDIHPPGSLGTVLGSIGALGMQAGYFIEWDATPHVATLVVEDKLGPAK